MRHGILTKSHIPLLLLSALLLTVSLTALAGTTYARFSTSKRQNLNFNAYTQGVWIYKESGGEPVSNGSGGFKAPDGWTGTDGSYTLSFVLANEQRDDAPVTMDQHAAVKVFITEGVEFASNASVTLNVGGVTYEGVPRQTEPDTALYAAYGAGRVYSFEQGGEPLVLFFEGSNETFIPAVLTVSGTYEYPAAVTVFVTPEPVS